MQTAVLTAWRALFANTTDAGGIYRSIKKNRSFKGAAVRFQGKPGTTCQGHIAAGKTPRDGITKLDGGKADGSWLAA
ncbi:hypothetical protein THS27_13140 [Thalassospira sp. MCCC 1A01428]|nr:hypothetical protein THS27_13140 [Thalassospira sp. MCCC 1A01428]